MWYCQASLISKLLIPVLCLLFKSSTCLYLRMFAPWPILSFYLEACVSVLRCLMHFFSRSAHLCTSTDTVIDRSLHQRGTCAWCSSDWHGQAFAPWSVPPPLQTWGQCVKTTEDLSGFHFWRAVFEVEGAGLSYGVDRCSLLIINPTNIWPHSWTGQTTGSRPWCVCLCVHERKSEKRVLLRC